MKCDCKKKATIQFISVTGVEEKVHRLCANCAAFWALHALTINPKDWYIKSIQRI